MDSKFYFVCLKMSDSVAGGLSRTTFSYRNRSFLKNKQTKKQMKHPCWLKLMKVFGTFGFIFQTWMLCSSFTLMVYGLTVKINPAIWKSKGKTNVLPTWFVIFGKQFPDGFIGQIAGLKWLSVQHEVPTLIWPHGFKGTSWNLCSLVEICMIYRLLWGSFAFHLGSPLLEVSP